MCDSDVYESGRVRVAMLALLLAALLGICPRQACAEQLDVTALSSDGGGCQALLDANFVTTRAFAANSSITITAPTDITGVYIVWESLPGSWQLETGGATLSCGEDEFLHEWVEIPRQSASKSVRMLLGPSQATIADIYAFSSGPLPDFVQQWEPSYDKADILVVSTHSDDEELFLGGVIPTYIDRGMRVQVTYFCNQFRTETHRFHERLNGLWTMGVRHYPQQGNFVDIYSESLEQASMQYNYADGLEWMVRTIRMFKPQVIVGHDFKGEYGHGGHMWCAKLIADALEPAADATQYADSAAEFGTWSVPKAYSHLYEEGQVEINARVPLATFGGRTCLDVLKEAYRKHLSQQAFWFFVSDGYDDAHDPNGYEYSCTKFGLYHTLVGPDTTGDDVMEHILPYDVQDRLETSLQQLPLALLLLLG